MAIGEEMKIKQLVLTIVMVGTIGLIYNWVIVFKEEGLDGFWWWPSILDSFYCYEDLRACLGLW
jgi:hypothetical protein